MTEREKWIGAIEQALGKWSDEDSRRQFADSVLRHLPGAYARGVRQRLAADDARKIMRLAQRAAERFQKAIDAQRALDAELERVGQLSVRLKRKSGLRTTTLEKTARQAEELRRRALLIAERPAQRPPGHLGNGLGAVIAGLYWVHFAELPGISRGESGDEPTPYLRACAAIKSLLEAQGRAVTLGQNAQKFGRKWADSLDEKLREELSQNGESEDSRATRQAIFDHHEARILRGDKVV